MKDREELQALGGLIALFTITAAWWALALWPVDNGPEWLARTRYVCFGVRESGLPDTGGWIGLIGGPAGMLTILLAGWRRGFGKLLQRARTSRSRALVLITLTLGTAALITGAGWRVQQSRSSNTTVVFGDPLTAEQHPRLDQPAPTLALTNQNGTQSSLADFAGRPVLVTFAYAHCSTICPLIVTHVLRAQDQLRGSAVEPAVLIVTLDPWRDTPSRLPAIAQSWRLPADAWVLGGTVEAVEAALDAWQIPRTRDTTTGEVTHPSLVYIIDREGRIAFASTGEVETLVGLLNRL